MNHDLLKRLTKSIKLQLDREYWTGKLSGSEGFGSSVNYLKQLFPKVVAPNVGVSLQAAPEV